MPGWQESIFPPYFVVGAMYSGFAMVVMLALAIRWGLQPAGDHHAPTISRSMAKILLMASIVMGYSYATEWFMAWYGGEHSERSLVAFEFTGTYAPLFWALLLCNVRAAAGAVVSARCGARCRRCSRSAIAINIGMWLERILIIWNTLSHDYMPSLWRSFHFTFWDWSFLIAPLGLFAFLFLLFVRLVPAVSMFDMRELAHRGGRGMSGPLLAEFRDPETLCARRCARSRKAAITRSTPSRRIRSKASTSELGDRPSRDSATRCWPAV